MTGLVASELRACEQVIERGLATFVDVGRALMRIRDSRLYRDGYTSFEEYCRDRWGMDRISAHRHIDAAKAVLSIDNTGAPVPVNVGQVRELAPIRDNPEAMATAMQTAQATAAAEGRAVTARDIRAAVRPEPAPEPPAEQITEEPEPPTTSPETAVRDRLAVHYSSATDEWATPQDFYDLVHAEFRPVLDVCCLPDSAKCDRYFTPDDDGLTKEWTGVCWMNPPYGQEIVDWIRKAHDSARDNGATVVCLVPARTDTAWWWDYCRHAEIRFIRGRLRFGTATASAPFPNALVIFGRDPKVVFWDDPRRSAA